MELRLVSWNVKILTTGPVKKDLIKFVSEKPNIATVTPDGIVKPIALGTTNIVVSYNGQEQDTLSLTIVPEKKK